MRAVVRLLVAASVLTVVLPAGPGPASSATKWDPIDPSELASMTPIVQKGADAEALAWDVAIEDDAPFGVPVSVRSHHLRIKIYTDRGRDQQSRVNLLTGGLVSIGKVEGRSVRRDGSFVELKQADIFERTLLKVGGVNVKATSFALPAVETGGIVEYRWRETYDSARSQNLRLPLSRNIPVQRVTYRILPLKFRAVAKMRAGSFRARSFHANDTLKVEQENDRAMVVMRNVPADIDEPHAPPAWDIRPWILIYYASGPTSAAPTQFWLDFSRDVAANWKNTATLTPNIQQAVDSLTLGKLSLDEKLSALVGFCRAKIKRIDLASATPDDRKNFDFDKPPVEALSTGRGTATGVMAVFLAMCRAAGIDAQATRLPNRNDIAFASGWMLPQLMPITVVAVRDGAHWRFVDPTNDYAPGGHLAWTEELVPALIADQDALVTETTPMSPPEWTLCSRTATLHLSEDGTLEGDVTAEYGGHAGMAAKEQEGRIAPAERETSYKEQMAARLPGIELTDVRVENVLDPDKAYVRRCHLRVPAYAQRTGSRLFLQPALFQKGLPPEFPAAERRYPIFFQHAWKDVDVVRIELPARYRLESPDAPAPVTLAPFGAYSMTLRTTADGRWIEMRRECYFGGGNRLQFPVNGYAALKQFFDAVAKADTHTLTLRTIASPDGRP